MKSVEEELTITAGVAVIAIRTVFNPVVIAQRSRVSLASLTKSQLQPLSSKPGGIRSKNEKEERIAWGEMLRNTRNRVASAEELILHQIVL